MKHLGTKTLETDRLILRPFRAEDAQAMYDYLQTQGIIVRNRHRGQLCANCLRITVGTPEEDDELMRAMWRFHKGE